MWDLLCLASFTLYNVFEVHKCCSMYLYFFLLLDSSPLYGWTVIVYPFFSSVDIWVGFSFCLLWEMMSGSECIKIFMWWYVFISLVKIPRSGIADVTFFFFLCWMACGILVLRTGFEAMPPTLEVQSLNHWTTREVPLFNF